MNAPEEVQIEQVIGPRLERGGVVIETLTPFGQVALRLSAAAALKLTEAVKTAIGQGLPELPRFLAADPVDLGPTCKRETRRLFRKPGRTRRSAA